MLYIAQKMRAAYQESWDLSENDLSLSIKPDDGELIMVFKIFLALPGQQINIRNLS